MDKNANTGAYVMVNNSNVWTQQRSDGKWESKREGAKQASKVTDTQEEAWEHYLQSWVGLGLGRDTTLRNV